MMTAHFGPFKNVFLLKNSNIAILCDIVAAVGSFMRLFLGQVSAISGCKRKHISNTMKCFHRRLSNLARQMLYEQKEHVALG